MFVGGLECRVIEMQQMDLGHIYKYIPGVSNGPFLNAFSEKTSRNQMRLVL